MPKNTHTVHGKKVVVSSRQILTPVSRQQGISVKVDPSGFWFLTTGTHEVDGISGDVWFSGLESDKASGRCTRCGSLNLMARTFWGGDFPKVWKGPPKAFNAARYHLVVTVGGQAGEVSGAVAL
jgi:hypothetical protein